MFYTLFKSRTNASTDPLVIYLTGGPGRWSQFAIFYENGPFKITEDITLEKNQYSWNEVANMLYVDQPLGTGFSYTNRPWDYARSEEMVAEYFYKFITKFYQSHPEFENRPLYIMGESYAGHFIPSITKYIIDQGQTSTNGGSGKINLISSAIGNAWIDPKAQYAQNLAYATENKLIGTVRVFLLKYAFSVCEYLISNPSIILFDYLGCESLDLTITGNPWSPIFNPYDVRKPCDSPPSCYDTSNLNKLLKHPEIREALNVGDRSWSDRFIVLELDHSKDYSPTVTAVLNSGIGFFVYNGDRDFVCNWRGAEAWTNAISKYYI